MAITVLLRLGIVVVFFLLLINVVLPLIAPRFRLFWMFRGKKAKESTTDEEK